MPSYVLGHANQLGRPALATLLKLTTVYTSREVENPLEMAKAKLTQAVTSSYDDLFTQHQVEWQKYWQSSDVQIDGDEPAQLALRFVLYHILILCSATL